VSPSEFEDESEGVVVEEVVGEARRGARGRGRGLARAVRDEVFVEGAPSVGHGVGTAGKRII
jgi:hypothetical protein